MRKHLLLLWAAWVIYLPLFAQLTIKVTAIPANTPPAAQIYLAGTPNNWSPGDPGSVLVSGANNTYQIVLNVAAGEVKFKFTRGSWPTVEGNANGGYLPDRSIQYNGGAQTVNLTILSWEDLGSGGTGSASANVFVLDEDFGMPQLNRNRKILIYLPPDYTTSGKRYPVLYMHDGQNLFDENTSFSGEWEVDESLNELFGNGDDGAIVVGIYNSSFRLDEYSPWVNPQYGGGQGDEYADWMVETLKPYVDGNYRTLSDREHTGIMGSSMGALISLYTAIEHQDVFGKVGIFSPAFWFAGNQAYTHVSSTGKQEDMKIYLLAGDQEDNGSVVDDLNAMHNTLSNAGFEDEELFLLTHNDGQHSEWYWAREFPDAYEWLFSNSTATSTAEESPGMRVRISPNPADSVLYLELPTGLIQPMLQIYAFDGRLIQPPTLIQGNQVNVSYLKPGTYILNILSEGRMLNSQKVVIAE
jgi:metallo-beta-lactamase class B